MILFVDQRFKPTRRLLGTNNIKWLKKILGDNSGFSQKDVMCDSLKINKENLHGNGFTLLRVF